MNDLKMFLKRQRPDKMSVIFTMRTIIYGKVGKQTSPDLRKRRHRLAAFIARDSVEGVLSFHGFHVSVYSKGSPYKYIAKRMVK